MLIFWAAEQMPRRDFFLKGFLKASRGYRLRSQQGFVRNSHFAAIFRGNFRRSPVVAAWAVLIQAVVFGIGHLYEGVVPVTRIMLFGVLFGLLALWRKSLRPGMIAHAWSDIFGVIIFRGM